MPLVRYSAVSSLGQRETGLIEAIDLAEARRVLLGRRLYPEKLEPVVERSRVAVDLGGRFHASRDAWIRYLFADQLAGMLSSGVGLGEALGEIISTAPRRWRAALTSVLTHVGTGESMAEALGRHPRLFDAAFVAAVRAGENSGRLGNILTTLAERLRHQAVSRRKLGNMLVYPAILLTLAGGATVFLVSYIFPKISAVISQAGHELPATTRILMAAGEFTSAHYGALVSTLAVAGALVFLLARSQKFRAVWDGAVIRMPVAGHLVLKAQSGRFLYTMGMLVESGVSAPEGLAISRGTLGNSYLRARLDEAEKGLMEGRSLAETLAACFVEIPGVRSILRSGGSAGQLGRAMLKAADILAADCESSMERLLAVLPSVVAVLLGAVVALIAMSVILPILELSRIQ